MRKSCGRCGRTHEMGGACPAKPPAGRRGAKGTRASRFRNTSAWRRARSEIQERDGYLCKLCAHEGRITYEGLETHHIAPLAKRFDLRLEGGNLVALCGSCHEKADRGAVPRALLTMLAAKEVPPLPPSGRAGGRADTNKRRSVRK